MGSDGEDPCGEQGGPGVRGEAAQSGAVDQGRGHLGGGGGVHEGGVVIAERDGGDLCIAGVREGDEVVLAMTLNTCM